MPLALITGAGRRIGRQLALKLAKNGWDIIAHYYSAEEKAKQLKIEISLYQKECHLVQADLSKTDQITHLFDELKENHLIPNLLINNAGIFPEKRKIEEIDDNYWNYIINTNLKSQLQMCKNYYTLLKITYRELIDKGRIINIASIGAVQYFNNRIIYNLSKAGVINLTKLLSIEMAPIPVNCICPGAVYIPEEPSSNDKYLIPPEKIPMQRWATCDDIFDVINFLANCTSYITGQIIFIDGGLSNTKITHL